MGPLDSTKNRRYRGLGVAVLLLVAALTRIAACWHWSDDLFRDPDAYRAIAEQLRSGEGYAAPDGRPTAFRPPLYPLLLAMILGAGPLGLAVFQITLGTATVGITYLVGRRLGLGSYALLAGGLVAVDPLLLRYAPRVMTETTCAFLAIALIGMLALERGRGGERGTGRNAGGHTCGWHTWLKSWGLGLLMGLAVLSRPTFWAVIILISADATFRQLFHWGKSSYKANYTRTPSPPLPLPPSSASLCPRPLVAAIIAAGLATAILPWAARNALVLGQPKITTTHGGYTLLLANNPVFWNEVVLGPPRAAWDGESLTAWQTMLEKELAEDGIDPRDELARDRWMRDRAITNIQEHPRLFVRASLYRLARFWGVVPLEPAAGDVPRIIGWSIGLFYSVEFLFAVIGLILLAIPGSRSRWAIPVPWRVLLWLILGFTLVHAVYWTDTRMRAPLVPAIALLATFGVRELSKIPRARSPQN